MGVYTKMAMFCYKKEQITKNDYKDREDKYVGSILAKLCMLSKRLDILVIFVAHPKKPDQEKAPMPTMYSISGSGDWYNMADYGIIVHRDRGMDGKLLNSPTVGIAKVKNFSLGNPSGGTITLKASELNEGYNTVIYDPDPAKRKINVSLYLNETY